LHEQQKGEAYFPGSFGAFYCLCVKGVLQCDQWENGFHGGLFFAALNFNPTKVRNAYSKNFLLKGENHKIPHKEELFKVQQSALIYVFFANQELISVRTGNLGQGSYK
jgi:hypothetical protein